MSMTPEQESKLARAQEIVGHTFENTQYLLSAITHPSATEGRAVKFSYERLEFLGDSILGALVASTAFHRFPDLDEGGLTRIKVALVSGASLSEVADKLGFADVIVFEELDSVLEEDMLKLAGSRQLPLRVHGRLTAEANDRGENTTENIAARLGRFFDRTRAALPIPPHEDRGASTCSNQSSLSEKTGSEVYPIFSESAESAREPSPGPSPALTLLSSTPVPDTAGGRPAGRSRGGAHRRAWLRRRR